MSRPQFRQVEARNGCAPITMVKKQKVMATRGDGYTGICSQLTLQKQDLWMPDVLQVAVSPLESTEFGT